MFIAIFTKVDNIEGHSPESDECNRVIKTNSSRAGGSESNELTCIWEMTSSHPGGAE
jgi:hypothetical protein